MDHVEKRVGKQIISILSSNPEVLHFIRELEKICSKYAKDNFKYGKESGGARIEILRWAYVGCFLSTTGGGDHIKERLGAYVEKIKNTLEQDKNSDPSLYIPEIVKEIFK